MGDFLIREFMMIGDVVAMSSSGVYKNVKNETIPLYRLHTLIAHHTPTYAFEVVSEIAILEP